MYIFMQCFFALQESISGSCSIALKFNFFEGPLSMVGQEEGLVGLIISSHIKSLCSR